MDWAVENFNFILEKFNNYYGDFRYFSIFIFALFINIALIKKEEKYSKNIIVYLPILILLLLFNPLVYAAVKPFADKGGVYWRFFWLIPLAPTVGYAMTYLVSSKDKIFSRVFLVICGALVILFAGKYMYVEKNFQKVDNVYKCPDDILYCIKIIGDQEKDNKKAMVPISVVPWVRQYDASISLEYKRSSMGQYARYVNLYETGNVKNNMKRLLDDGCNFFVIYRAVNCDVNFEDYGCIKIGENDSYLVYMLE